MIYEIVIMLLAGWGAGVVTGLVGASAVVIVTPILITFLGVNPYTAIGISLATDVVASSVSAYTYKKNDNIRIKEGINISVLTVIAAIIGSYLSNFMSATALGGSTGIVIIFMGISFIRTPLNERLETFKEKVNLSFWQDRKILSTIFFGTFIGLMTGIFGAGGGMMILIVLAFIFGYPIHMAVGTSVLIMTFSALSGSISHFVIEQYIPITDIIICGIGAYIGAVMAANYANIISEKKLSKLIGFVFVILGLISLLR